MKYFCIFEDIFIFFALSNKENVSPILKANEKNAIQRFKHDNCIEVSSLRRTITKFISINKFDIFSEDNFKVLLTIP